MCPGSANTPTASALLMMNAYDISDDENCDYTYSTEQVDGVIKVPFTVSAPGDYAELKITHSVFIFLGNAIIADIASTWYIKAQNNPAIEYVCTDDGFGNCDSIIDSGSRGVNGTDITCALITPGDYVLIIDVHDINTHGQLTGCEIEKDATKILSPILDTRVTLEIAPASCP